MATCTCGNNNVEIKVSQEQGYYEGKATCNKCGRMIMASGDSCGEVVTRLEARIAITKVG